MKQEHIEWLIANEAILKGILPVKDPAQFIKIYNEITGENQKPTSCGRCWRNMKHRLQFELKNLQNMQEYPVYRTAKGNLSFKKQGISIFTIRSNSKAGADEAMLQLKAFERTENKKIENK